MREAEPGATGLGAHLGLSAILIAVVAVAWMAAGAPAGLGVALASLLLLYLLGFRSILREHLRQRRELETRLPLLRGLRDAAAGKTRPEPAGVDDPPASPSELRRRFALGTVAVLEGALDPEQLETVAREQERRSGKRFGLVAVELGLLTLAQLADLVRAQREGRFSIAEMRRARKRLVEARRREVERARSPGGPPRERPPGERPGADPPEGPAADP